MAQVLGVDVQLMILDALSQSSPRSLLNVALSSRSLNCLSRRFIYRVIPFTFNRKRRAINGRLIKQLLTDDDLSTNVREIRVLWAPSAKLQPGEGSKQDLELLGQALSKLTGLKTFIWDAQYPIMSWLLQSLQTQRPECLLYIRHPASQGSAQTLPRLCHSPRLFSLDVKLTDGQISALVGLQKVVTSVPNLRDLAITAALSSSQVISYQTQGESEREYEPLRLRSLALYGCMLDTLKISVVWSKLERLSLDSSSFPSFIPCLPGLIELRLEVWSDITCLRSVLKGCTKLELLDMTGCLTVLLDEDLWESIGKSLTKVRLHEDIQHGSDARPLIPFSVFENIAKHCRNLRSLGFDLECNGREWPCMMLKFVAEEMWFLVHLELNILIRDPQHDHLTSPKATLESVPEVWKFLWQEILSSRVRRKHPIITPRLRSMDLIAGSLRPVQDPSSQEWQLDQQRFTFDLCERDDEARFGIADVKSTEVEALRSKLFSSENLWNFQQELVMKCAYERAWTGPHVEMPSVTDSEMVRPSPFWDKLDKNRFHYR